MPTMEEKIDKINLLKEKLSELWHGDDAESGDFGKMIEDMMHGKLEKMTQELVVKIQDKVLEKIQKNVQHIIAKQAAKFVAQTALKGMWGVGTLWHGASALYCGATGDYEGFKKEGVMAGGATLPGVGTAMELADTANKVHDAYLDIMAKIDAIKEIFATLNDLCEAATDDDHEGHSLEEIDGHPDGHPEEEE